VFQRTFLARLFLTGFRGVAILAALSLAACAIGPKQIEQANVSVSNETKLLWLQHQQKITSAAIWSAKGRVALRSEKESWSATLTWQQNVDDYHVRLAGPFGQGAVTIEGSPDTVSVHIAGQEAVVASDAEALLLEHLGWSVPVSSLRYWLRGLPAPGQIEGLTLNASGVLDQLNQQGWQIDYSAYRPLRGVNLPRKIKIENDNLRLKLVLDQWSLPS